MLGVKVSSVDSNNNACIVGLNHVLLYIINEISFVLIDGQKLGRMHSMETPNVCIYVCT